MEQRSQSFMSISNETGQLDPRFSLWREFCAHYGLAVDTLSSDLDADLKGQWEMLKESELDGGI